MIENSCSFLASGFILLSTACHSSFYCLQPFNSFSHRQLEDWENVLGKISCTISSFPCPYRYLLWEADRKDRILSYMGNWTLYSYSSQAGDCYHRGKLAITCNSITITKPPKHIYKCQKWCSNRSKYLDWFKGPLTLQKLWLQDSVSLYTSKHEYLQHCSNRGSDLQNVSQEATKPSELLARSKHHTAGDWFLLVSTLLRSKLSLGIPVLQCGHSHNVHNEHLRPKEKTEISGKARRTK